jgi:hypothetical protein
LLDDCIRRLGAKGVGNVSNFFQLPARGHLSTPPTAKSVRRAPIQHRAGTHTPQPKGAIGRRRLRPIRGRRAVCQPTPRFRSEPS